MNQFLKRGLLAAALLFSSFLSVSAHAVELTDAQEYDLNKRFSPSVAAKVEIGTAIRQAQKGTFIDDNVVTMSMLNEAVLKEATGTLSQANIQAMNGAAVTLIAAPGAGKIVVVESIEWFHDYATAAYADGGDVTVEYATSGLDIEVFDVALVTAGADDNWMFKPAALYVSTASTGSHVSLTSSVNKAVVITNTTGAFTGGNASNVIKWKIRYRVLTLLT